MEVGKPTLSTYFIPILEIMAILQHSEMLISTAAEGFFSHLVTVEGPLCKVTFRFYLYRIVILNSPLISDKICSHKKAQIYFAESINSAVGFWGHAGPRNVRSNPVWSLFGEHTNYK